MDEAVYQALVATAFKRLLKGLDTVDPDLLEADSTGDMITVTGAKSGAKVVINTQRAVHQVWVAGAGQGIHFTYDGTKWLDDKGKGFELYAWVSSCVEAACGARVAL